MCWTKLFYDQYIFLMSIGKRRGTLVSMFWGSSPDLGPYAKAYTKKEMYVWVLIQIKYLINIF